MTLKLLSQEHVFHEWRKIKWIGERSPLATWQIGGAGVGGMMANFARFLRVTVGLSACLSVVSCVTPLRDNVPPLVESRARDVVAVIDVISVRYYERTGGFGYPMVDKNGQESIQWASPPPFRVRAHVIAQLYGPLLGGTITFKTHSHYGKDGLANGKKRLVHLVTDGNIVMMSDDNQIDVGIGDDGELIAPVGQYETIWLPCRTSALNVPISARNSRKFRMYLPSSEVDDEQKTYFWFEDRRKYKYLQRKYPRFGIPIDQLAIFLKEKEPRGEDFWCRED